MTAGKGKGHEGVQGVRMKTQPTTSRTETVSTVRTKDTLQGAARKELTMRKPRQANIVTIQRATA